MKPLLNILLFLVTLLVLEGSSYLLLNHALPMRIEKTRQFYLSDSPLIYQNSIAQPYLLYSLSPNYKDHNKQGFRGKPVNFEKSESTIRFLFLGGSTTYGWLIGDASQTYPTLTGEILTKKFKELNICNNRKIEIINAGLPNGTSAEIFTHFHFKYSYFNPDIVILNTGGNDSISLTTPFYHPDYSHQRKQIQSPQRFSKLGKVFFQSRLFWLFFAPFMEDIDYLGKTKIVNLNPSQPPATQWYPRMTTKESLNNYPNVPKTENAFRNNVMALLNTLSSKDIKTFVFPFREAPQNQYTIAQKSGFEVHRRLLKEISDHHDSATFIPFPSEVISPNNWGDSCHLNEKGSNEKAKHLVTQLLSSMDWGSYCLERK